MLSNILAMPKKETKAKPDGKDKAKPDALPAPPAKNSKGKPQQPPPAPSAKQQKAAKKTERAAVDAERRAEQDRMLTGGGDEAGAGDDGSDDDNAMTTDRFGNTVSKAKAAEDQRAELVRAEARARREAKAAAAASSAEAEGDAGGDTGGGGASFGDRARAEMDAVVAKAAAGGKLTKKEQKLLKRAENREAEEVAEAEAEQNTLGAFSLSLGGAAFDEGDEGGGGGGRDVVVHDFTISAPSRPLLVDAHLSLRSGRRYGLLGQNGSGKSTLMRFLAARKLPVPRALSVLHVEQEASASAVTLVEQVLAADAERARLLAEADALEAEIDREAEAAAGGGGWDDATWAERVARLAALSDALAACGADAAEARARRVLIGLGFAPRALDRGSLELSGGWRMRVSLAGALFIAPDVLLLDEPTNHLDLEAVLWLGQYLLTYPHTLVLVSHDRAFLDEVTTDTINFHDQKLLNYRGSHEVFVRTAEDHAKQQRREYDAYVEKRAHMQEFIDKFRCSASRASLVQSRVKAVEKMAAEAPDEPPQPPAPFRFVIPSPDAIGRPVISVEDVSFDYPLADPEASPSPPPADGAAPPPPPPPPPAPPRMRPQAEWLPRKANFPVDLESRVGIVGVNGAGKSTLLNLIMEQLKPLEGQVRRNPRCRVGHFSQHAAEKFDLQKSALENLLAMNPETLSEQECRNLAGRFQIRDQDALKPMQMLSGGQKSRVAFASLVAAKPHVIIMDEPTNHLDFESIDALIVALSDFKGGLVVVSHDQHFITSTCTEIWSVEGGAVSRMRGTFDDYKKAALKRTQAAVAASVKRLVSTR